MAEKPTTQAEMLLAQLLAAQPSNGLAPIETGMPPLAPMPAPQYPSGQIPYDTQVSAQPSAWDSFVDSLDKFRQKAMDMAPVTAIPRQAARSVYQYQQGNTGRAALEALPLAVLAGAPMLRRPKPYSYEDGGDKGLIAEGASVVMNPVRQAAALPPAALMAGMGVQPGAKLSPDVALRNALAGMQSPEHAARMLPVMGATRMNSSPNMSAASAVEGNMVANTPLGQPDPYGAALALQKFRRMQSGEQ